MYALLALLSVLSVWLAARVLTIPGEMTAGRFQPRKAALTIGGYVLVSAAGLWTHYSFPLILAAQTVAFGVWLAGRRMKKHGLFTWVGLQIVILLLFAPWIPNAIRQIFSWPTGAASPVDTATFLTTLAYGPTLPTNLARWGLLPLIALVIFGTLPPTHADTRYLRHAERIIFVVSWLLIPVIALAAIGPSEPFLKFLLPANLALMLLAGRGLWLAMQLAAGDGQYAIRAGIVGMTLLALVMPLFSGLDHLYNDPTYARDDYRAIAERIQREAGDDAAVILVAPNQWEVFTYYYPDGLGVAPLPKADTQATLERIFGNYSRIYALYWGADQQDAEGSVRRRLDENAFALGADWYGGVELVTYLVAGDLDAGIIPVDTQLGTPPAISLDGYTLTTDSLVPGEALGVTLYWSTRVTIDARLKVFVHLYAPDGTLIAQHDAEPGAGRSPTNSWSPNEMVIDLHGLLLPTDAPSGDYHLDVGLYRPEDATRLPVTVNGEEAGDTITLTQITVE